MTEKVYMCQYNSAHEHNMLPLAAGMLVSSAKADPRLRSRYEFSIKFLRESPERAASVLVSPAIAAFSCYLWNVHYSLCVAKLVKQAYPHALIVFGGPSVPRSESSASKFLSRYPFIDVLAAGEGEQTFKELLAAYGADQPLTNVTGLFVRDQDDRTVFTGSRERIKDLSVLPSPYLDGTFDTLLTETGASFTGGIIETNRGCPFSCTFCDWGQATESRLYLFDEERVSAEIDWISAQGINYLFCADANFGIKRRDLGIAQYIAEVSSRHGYPNIFFVNWTKNAVPGNIQLAETLTSAGLVTIVTLSVQSYDETTLQSIKRSNIRLSDYKKLKSAYHARGIPTYTDILLGLPGETYTSFTRNLVANLTLYPGDHISLNPVYMLENAEISTPESRQRFQIQTRLVPAGAWRRKTIAGEVREYEEVVISTDSMPLADWRRAYLFGHLLVALHDYKLANFLLYFIGNHMQADVATLIEFVIDMARLRKETLLARIVAHMEECLDAIIEEREQVLPVKDYEERRWPACDAVFLLANDDLPQFYKELNCILKEFCGPAQEAVSVSMLDDLLRYQAVLLHGREIRKVLTTTLNWDWPQYFTDVENDAATTPRPSAISVKAAPGKGSDSDDYRDWAMGHLMLSAHKAGLMRRIETDKLTTLA